MLLRKIAFVVCLALSFNFALAQERPVIIVEDISKRIVVNKANFDQHVKAAGKVVFYICADNPGNVTQVQVLRSKSSIKDFPTLSALANEACRMTFNPIRKAFQQCGEMTFTFEAPTKGRDDVVAASNMGEKKIFGSRPTPPSTRIEAGDLTARKILRNVETNELTEEKGQVVMYICADKSGRVIKSEVVEQQSTIKDSSLHIRLEKRSKIFMKFAPSDGMDCMYYTFYFE